MMAIERWLSFVQPANKRCDPEYVFMSEFTAIQCWREAHPDILASDGLALDEFMMVHWAQWCNRPEGIN